MIRINKINKTKGDYMNKPDKEHFIEGKNVKDINIKYFFEVIKKRFWIVILITMTSTTVGYFFSNYNHTPIYETSTRIIIEADDNFMSTLMVMIKDSIIMQKVQDELELSRSPESIASQIEITRIDESQVIKISVKDQDPMMAMDIANATARSFKSEIGNILEFNDVQLLSEAKQNNAPINENKNQIVIITFVIGIITGIGLVFLLDSLDETVEKESEVEEILNVPVLGVISNMKKVKNSSTRIISQKEMLEGDKVGVNE